MQRSAILVTVLLLAAPAPAALRAGDLLVTDQSNARVLVVHPDTGGVEVLSPPLGGPNLLVAPAGIVMADTGVIYVVDETTDQLVAIDAATGTQSLVLDFLGNPVDVGSDPYGLALWATAAGSYNLYVSARGSHEIRNVAITPGFSIVSSALSTDARWAHARGVAVDVVFLSLYLDVAMDDGQGYWQVLIDNGFIQDPLLSNGNSGVDESPGIAAFDVEPYEYSYSVQPLPPLPKLNIDIRVILSLQQIFILIPHTSCDPTGSRLIGYGTETLIALPGFHSETVEPADGTPLQCPFALATGLDGALYATDAQLPNGRNARLVRLQPGTDDAPVVVAPLSDEPETLALPAGLAVAPVPEPDGEGAAASVTLGALALALSWQRSSRAGPRAARL